MNYLLLILSIFLLSNTAYSYDICESTFIRSVHREKVKAIYKRYKSLKISRIDNLRSTPEKLEAIEEAYNLISRDYHANKSLIKIEVNKYKDLTINAKRELQQKLEQELLQDNINELNTLVKQSYELLRNQGIEVELISREFMGIKNTLSIKLNSLPPKKYSRSIDLLERYRKRFGTQTVSFDLTENLINGFAGFSQAATKRIDLGIKGIKNILVDDLVTMVAKHEFMHAAFAAKRAKGQISVYHAEYMSQNGLNLSSVNSGYNKYMSAEEIHNWANNSFWGSSRLSDITKYSKETYRADLEAILQDIMNSKNIFNQGIEVSQKTIETLKVQKDLISNHKSTLVFTTQKKQLAKTSDVADYVAIESVDGSFIYFDFVGDPKTRILSKKILTNRQKLDLKYSQYRNAGGQLPEERLMEFVAEDAKFSKDISMKILDDLIERQTQLNTFAKNALKARDETEQVAEDFLKMLYSKKEINPDYLNSPEVIEAFNDFRKQLRRYGNSVKEGYVNK